MPLAIHRKFIAGVAILSIAMTAFATAPARADDDTKRAVAAILGLALLGAAIADANKDKKVVTQPRARHSTVQPRPRYNTVQPRPLPDRVNRRLLPQRCLRTFEGRRGTMAAFGRRCLNRNYDFAHRLPAQCYSEVRTDRGIRGVYRARCLRREGYQLARH